MILPLAFDFNGRKIEVAFDIEPDNAPDAGLLAYIKHGSPCEPEVCQVLARVVHEGDVVIDAGANIGFFTVILSRFVGATGRVLAIEPGANNIGKFNRNIMLNGCRNVTLIDKPIFCSPVDVPLYLYADGGANSLWNYGESDQSVMIRATTLDAICVDVRPKLIKMDIEGGESEAVAGACKMLATYRPFIVTEMNTGALKRAGSTPYKLRKLLEGFGYRPFVMHIDGSLPTQVPSNCRIEPRRQNSNVLFSTSLDVGKAWQEVII